MVPCELAYGMYVLDRAQPEILDKLDVFYQHYEKTDIFIGRN